MGRQSVGNEWVFGLGDGACPPGQHEVVGADGAVRCEGLGAFFPAWTPWALLGVVAASALSLHLLTRGGR